MSTMASRTAITFVDTDNMLKFFGEKLNDLIEDFKANEIWLKEIQEEATKMFVCDFNGEPELMPKTPSERKLLRKRLSVIQDSNNRFSRSRKSFRRSSVRRPKLLNRIFVEDNGNSKSRTEQACPVNLTPSESPARATMASLETEKHNIVPVNSRVPLIELSLNDCKPPELQKSHVANLAQSLLIPEDVNLFQETVKAKQPESETILETAVNPSSPNPEGMKLKIDVTAKVNAVTGDTHLANWELGDTPIADGGSNSGEVENKLVRNHNCRLVRKSISSRRSSSFRLMDKFSLNVQWTTMVQESSRKSLHKSIAWRKNMQESSASSYHNSIQKLKKNMEEECVEVTEPNQNQPVMLGPEKHSPRCTRNATKIVKANLENVSRLQACRNSPRFQGKDGSNSAELNSDNLRLRCKNNYRQGVENVHNHTEVLNCDDSLPRKKTASPSCPPSKKKIRLKNLKKQEEVRIQRQEEELKKKRHLRCVLETRSRVDQQEEEKKRKAEQKNSQIDEKMREKCLAERAKKKATRRKEEAKSQRPQEEAQKQKLQVEEKHQELLQQEEEELEKQHKIAEARKLQEQQPSELEKAKLHVLQVTTDRQWERKREQEHIQTDKEREHLEKDKAIQLQQKLEQTTPEDAALLAEQEQGQLHEATQDKERKLEEQQLKELGSLTLANREATSLKLEPKQQENGSRLCEDQRKCKEEKNWKVKEEVSNKNILNVHHSTVLESYTMTPNGYSKIKLSQVNLETYGMDLQSDDSTDDEGAPRKPIPTWANGAQLQQALVKQYYHPLDLDKFFGVIQPPNLENIFGKSKPRYLKRTSSAVWLSPPASNSIRNVPYGFMKY
ncbi:inner centromere protein B-like isoform X1 [Chiloscyllium punctatum]|uniref:inner centromere protein B-like isoform X1 n=2 Tax=Chiloscyllium punctatum TaxID=137246 RepID=UPI003B6338B1